MKREEFMRATFAGLVCVVSLPWLTPCAPGSENTSIAVSPDRDRLYQEVPPGAVLNVLQNESISRQLLISSEEAGQLTPIKGNHWKQVDLSDTPLVVLEGDDIWIAREGKRDTPSLALASTRSLMAKITIATSQGTLFATADRIHFRGASSEIVLEGTPFVQFGRQQIRTASPKALMKLDFTRLAVFVSGRAVATKF